MVWYYIKDYDIQSIYNPCPFYNNISDAYMHNSNHISLFKNDTLSVKCGHFLIGIFIPNGFDLSNLTLSITSCSDEPFFFDFSKCIFSMPNGRVYGIKKMYFFPLNAAVFTNLNLEGSILEIRNNPDIYFINALIPRSDNIIISVNIPLDESLGTCIMEAGTALIVKSYTPGPPIFNFYTYK